LNGTFPAPKIVPAGLWVGGFWKKLKKED